MNRCTASTNMNETSSRSHAALMITITMRDDIPEVDESNKNTDNVAIAADNSNGKPASYRESSLVIVDLAVSDLLSC